MGRSSSPGSVNNLHFSVSSRQALEFTQPPLQFVPGALSPGRGKAAGPWSWPLTSNYCREQEYVGLQIHSPYTSSWQGAWVVKLTDNFTFYELLILQECQHVRSSKLLYDWQSVSQYVLVSTTLVGLATRYYFLSECSCLKFAVLFLWGALPDERTGLQFAV
jgi:hypothetical protein